MERSLLIYFSKLFKTGIKIGLLAFFLPNCTYQNYLFFPLLAAIVDDSASISSSSSSLLLSSVGSFGISALSSSLVSKPERSMSCGVFCLQNAQFGADLG